MRHHGRSYQNRRSFWPCVVSLVMNWSIVEHNLGESSGSTVDVARRAGYPGPEQMDRKMLRFVEKRGFHAARNGPSEDRKCWQHFELGIHGLKSWGRNWSRKVRETRSSRRPSRSRRRKGLATFGRPGSVVGRQHPLGHCSHASRPTPPAGNWLRFSCSIPPLFVLSHSLPMVNTMGKLASFGRFSITASSLPSRLTDHYSLATRFTSHVARPTIVGVRLCRAPNWVHHAPPGRHQHAMKSYVFGFSAEVWRAWFSAQLNM